MTKHTPEEIADILIEKRLEGIEKYYEEMKEIVEDKEATPEMRSNARSFIRGMDYIRKHMRL